MAVLWNRMVRAAKLEPAFYREMVEDPKAINHSRWVVVIYAMAAAMGAFGKAGGMAVNTSVVIILLGWYVWAFSIYFIGTRFLPEPETPRDRKAVMRALGYAAAPGISRLLGLVPGLGVFALAGGNVWMLAAGVVATKEALNYSSLSRAAGVCIACGILSLLFQVVMIVMVISALGIPNRGF